MKEIDILTKYLFPMMLHTLIVAFITFILRKNNIIIGYESVVGIVLIVLAGVSSALWGILYQCRYNHKNFWEIIREFFDVRQSLMSYLLVLMFLVIIFGRDVLGKGFQVQNMWIPILLFLKAIAFGGIEEIGWRYTFQPVMEKMVTYIPAVFITFVCWGIWHILFFYIDGSLENANIILFLLGLLTNCFVLSALYAYSGSLWICVMTHALINALSQITVNVDENIGISILLKMVCISIAVGLYYMASKQHV